HDDAWRAIRNPAPDPHEQALEQRTAEVQRAVDRVISATAAGDEQRHTDWCHRFDREVEDWSEAPDWIVDDVDTVIRRVCKALGLPDDYAQRWRQLPEPTFFPDPEEPTPEEREKNAAAMREITAHYKDALACLRAGEPIPKPPWRNSG
ncbi:hypothetical protein, partial [Tolypothrix sp. VBCCA 56010]|uniref:hypothetical protein n=1 Tax=Tolypothrix sp. VBCCA 56010 TaxID=3137731 RepID=UPI003D7D9F93